MSRINCVRSEAKASVEPSLLGTIAMFEVMAPSSAFSVETFGWLRAHPPTVSGTPVYPTAPPSR